MHRSHSSGQALSKLRVPRLRVSASAQRVVAVLVSRAHINGLDNAAVLELINGNVDLNL